MTQQVLTGKTGVVFGVANKRSIAWAIAKAWAAAGARLIFNYQGERLKENLEELVGEFGEKTPFFPCDVSSDDEIKSFFEKVRGETDHVDLMLHSLAFAPKEALEGDFLGTTREAFRVAHDISAYSLVALAREITPMMTNGGSILAMTYYGSEKVVPHYNVMGVAKAALEASVRYLAADLGGDNIRVNAISAGPIKTLAAYGIGDFHYILKWNQLNSPLQRNVTIEEVGGSAVYLLSDLSSGVTGEVHHVDCGYHVVGMKRADAPDIAVV
jgi:enoyl-[acyl-carrier protein] reductase I